MSKNRKVRYAVVGLGHIDQVAVLPAFAHTSNSELVAIVSGDGEKLEKVGDQYDLEHRIQYDDYDDFLAKGHVDAVYIGLPKPPVDEPKTVDVSSPSRD